MGRKELSHYEKYGKVFYEKHREQELARSKDYYKKNKEAKLERHRDYVLRSRYGISKSDYLDLLESQNYSCAICGSAATKTLDVDHDHTTGKVRGLLCNNCNRGIGHLKDSPQILLKAVEYLVKHSSVV